MGKRKEGGPEKEQLELNFEKKEEEPELPIERILALMEADPGFGAIHDNKEEMQRVALKVAETMRTIATDYRHKSKRPVAAYEDFFYSEAARSVRYEESGGSPVHLEGDHRPSRE